MKGKGQLSIEYTFLMAIGFVMLIIALIYVGERMTDMSQEAHKEMVIDVASAIQSEMSFAGRATPGYKRQFFVPIELNGIEYNITQLGRDLIISTDRFEYGVSIPYVEGNVSKGFNTIRNIDEWLCIEPKC